MGTNNFAKTNTQVIHAVATDDEFTWRNTRDNIVTDLEAEDVPYDFCEDYNLGIYDNGSYPAMSIGGMYISEDNYDITLRLKTVSGYYTGFTLDYELQVTVDFETDDIGEVSDTLKDIETQTEDLIEYVEKLYSQYSNQLTKVAQFSNGEAVYETVK